MSTTNRRARRIKRSQALCCKDWPWSRSVGARSWTGLGVSSPAGPAARAAGRIAMPARSRRASSLVRRSPQNTKRDSAQTYITTRGILLWVWHRPQRATATLQNPYRMTDCHCPFSGVATWQKTYQGDLHHGMFRPAYRRRSLSEAAALCQARGRAADDSCCKLASRVIFLGGKFPIRVLVLPGNERAGLGQIVSASLDREPRPSSRRSEDFRTNAQSSLILSRWNCLSWWKSKRQLLVLVVQLKQVPWSMICSTLIDSSTPQSLLYTIG